MSDQKSMSTVKAIVEDPAEQLKTEMRAVVRQVLDKWAGYQIAVTNQLAGERSREKDVWFEEVIAEYLLDERTAEREGLPEFSDWLDDILDEEFDLVLEDGTLEMTAKLLRDSANTLTQRAATTKKEKSGTGDGGRDEQATSNTRVNATAAEGGEEKAREGIESMKMAD